MSHPHRVLLVEDDPEIRLALSEVLADEGLEVEAARDGRDALEKLQSRAEKPCVILLDLMMPHLDGRGFREAQRRAPELADIPVVVLSAGCDGGDVARELAVPFLAKPVQLGPLLDAMAGACKARP